MADKILLHMNVPVTELIYKFFLWEIACDKYLTEINSAFPLHGLYLEAQRDSASQAFCGCNHSDTNFAAFKVLIDLVVDSDKIKAG